MRTDKEDIYRIKSKTDWMKDAANALISVTTPEMRFMMRVNGFQAFEQKARIAFNEDAGLRFTSIELRKIFAMVMYWHRLHESHVQPILEKQYDETRRRTWKADEEISDDDRAEAEAVMTERVDRGVMQTEEHRGKRVIH